jgi:cytochrome P450
MSVTPQMSIERAAEIAAGFDLRDLPPDFYTNPYPVYAALRATDPVRRMPDGSIFLTRYADIVSVYRDAKVFSSDKKVEFGPKYNGAPSDDQTASPGAGQALHEGAKPLSPLFEHHTTSLVFNDPPAHTQVRRLIVGALTRRAIADMESGLVTLVDSLLDRIESRAAAGQDCDLIEDYATVIPVEIIGNLLNIPHADRAPLRGWSLAILGALEPRLTAAQQHHGENAVRDFLAYLKHLVAERRSHPGDAEHDVLTRLIQGEAGSGGDTLSEQVLLHNCIFILNAGHETTTNLIGNTLAALQDWPDQKTKLLSQLELTSQDPQALEDVLNLAIDEFLRFEASNQLGNRRAVQDCSVGGVPLPQGSLLTLCIGAANRDPAQFSLPETLDLARETANKHLSFGFGVHQCVGLSLARMEGRVAIGRFLQRFPDYRLTAPPLRGGRARFRGFLKVPFQTGS